jgi:hypothetical protein
MRRIQLVCLSVIMDNIADRSPTYYKFNEAVYKKALKEGLVLV